MRVVPLPRIQQPRKKWTVSRHVKIVATAESCSAAPACSRPKTPAHRRSSSSSKRCWANLDVCFLLFFLFKRYPAVPSMSCLSSSFGSHRGTCPPRTIFATFSKTTMSMTMLPPLLSKIQKTYWPCLSVSALSKETYAQSICSLPAVQITYIPRHASVFSLPKPHGQVLCLFLSSSRKRPASLGC